MNQKPPIWPLRFLRWFCKPSLLEAIEGDLLELFEDRLHTGSAGGARRSYWWDVLRFFRIRYIKGLEDMNSFKLLGLYKNYFKVSIRNIIHQKFYSVINIVGLSLGLACVMLILLFIQNELSYDKFYKDHESIYRVALNNRGTQTPSRLASTFKLEYPEIEAASRLNGSWTATFVANDKIIKQEGGYMADSTVFEVFSIGFLQGNSKTALVEPNSIVLSEETALKYFNSTDVMGTILKVDGEEVKVTGIIENSRKNTHFPYTFLMSMPREDWITNGYWTGNNFYTYLKLHRDADVAALEAKFPEFVKKYIGPEIIGFTGHSSYEEYLKTGRKHGFNLIKMTDIHLYHPRFSMGEAGDINNVYIFGVVALFILLLACINFINLSTARSTMRSKEVGIRKVMGSARSSIVSQFLVESTIISMISLSFALFLAALAIPAFSNLAGRSFEQVSLFQFDNIMLMILIILFVGLVAGSYPAFFISGFQPIKALKGRTGSGGSSMRKLLVIFQFSVSLILIVCTYVVFSQLQYMSNQKLGFDASQGLVIKNGTALTSDNSFITEISSHPSIESVTKSNNYPSRISSNWGYSTVGENQVSFSPMHIFTDDKFVETIGLELIRGEYFQEGRQSDSSNVVINEAFAERLPYDDPIGQELTRGSGSRFRIIGIVKDFNYATLKKEIQPLLIRFQDEGYGTFGGYYLTAKVSGNYREVVDHVASVWNKHSPEEPFEYVFLDESFNSLYETEERQGMIFVIFSVLAIIIACLGLFALAAFSLQKRIKEIVVRKVMGASISELFKLLIADFSRWVVVGVVLGLPVSWYLMNEWLKEFSYAVPLDLLLFIIPVFLLLLIAWITVSLQIFRVSRVNPTEVLSED